MKKNVLILVLSSLFLIACVDKKAEEEKKAKLEEQVESIDQEINEGFDSLEKEAEEIDEAINELDNL